VDALQENLPLSEWTTFGIGGPARYFLNATSEQDVFDALDFAKAQHLPVFVLGGGSNLLVADRGFNGLVLRIGIKGMSWHDSQAIVAAGEDWDGVVAACVERKLGGVECLSGIPGLAGGTPVQNVGAYGQEIADVLVQVRVMDRSSERIVDLSKEQCGFSYRTSIFNTTQKERYIVLSISYALQKDATPLVKYPDLVRRFESHSGVVALSEVRKAVREIRAGKGMLIPSGSEKDDDSRSAGSFFKNPILTEEQYSRIQDSAGVPIPRYPADDKKVKTSAAWLIDKAGFGKGFTIGRAGISTKHTLALVNRGGASAADIIRLGRAIRSRVEDKFGVRLVPEPVFLGFDENF
jgi:UDP-N-acetylmuramate dehydrogenase